MDKVALITAFEWCCDECGRTNFCSSIKVEDPDATRAAIEDHGMYGELCMMPETVKCKNCGTSYDTEESE